MPRPLLGAAAGLLAGALVGLGEALVLQSAVAVSTEYVALFYAAALYGLIGAALGLIPGLLLGAAAALGRRISPQATYTASFLLVCCGLSWLIVRSLLDRYAYLGLGLPRGAELAAGAGVAGLALLILWLGPIFLTRTPFKIVLTPRGTVALNGALALLTAVFSFAPPRGSPYGTVDPPLRAGPPERTPDVLLILVSSLRADRVNPEHTPHIADLARDGLVFERAFSSSSWTRPGAASLLTGMVPRSHGATLPVSVLPDEVDTLAEAMTEAGYVTGGLPNSAWLTRSANFQQGFDYYRFLAPEYVAGASETASRLRLYPLAEALRDWLSGGRWRAERHYTPADEALGYAREFIDARRDGRPWFLFVHLADPSPPWFDHGGGRGLELPPPGADPAGAIAAYEGELRWMDGELGTFLDWLKREGHYENTVILLTADHGIELGDRGGFGAGETLYDELLQVPLVLKLPGGELAGSRVPWQVRTLDVAPTLTGIVGRLGSPIWQGKDLLDGDLPRLLSGPGRPNGRVVVHPLDRPVFAETIFRGAALSAIRDRGWKLIRANRGNPRGLGEVELYHIADDPAERRDRSGEDPERQAALDRALVEQITVAASVSVYRATAELDEASRARIEALGYME